MMNVIALNFALQSALALFVSHLICVAIVMYFDLTGKWDAYKLHKKRNVSITDYRVGLVNFVKDLTLLFVPFLAICFSYRLDAVQDCRDSVFQSLLKLVSGYLLGKIWAFAIHYALHWPSLYQFHRKHHGSPATLVAARAWEDSLVEYAIMELPSFAATILLFPTHLCVHLMHFAWHGWDGACGHSGFGGVPGILGFLFDGTYHYHHHNLLTVNYAELEFLDIMAGTHHSQKRPRQTA